MKYIFYFLILFLVGFSCKNKNKIEEISTENTLALNDDRISSSKIDSTNFTEIKFKETDFSYGIIPINSKVHHYYVFTNTGTKPLTISNVAPSCGCTVPKYPTKPILPGESDSIMLEFNSENFSGEIHKSATLTANIKEPIILKFSGNIQNK